MAFWNKKESKEEKALRKQREKRKVNSKNYPFLDEIRPREKYVFHSDYFDIDNQVGCILSFFHKEGATDNFGSFWGINRIPSGLSDKVSIVSIEQISKMTEGWLQQNQTRAEGVASINENEQNRSGTSTSKNKASRKSQDFQIIAQELQNGAAYLNVHWRLLVKAPTLDDLDYAVNQIERMYIDRFGTLEAAPYAGNQRLEFATLFSKNAKKVGRGYYFTSTELAGSYSLVTHGMEDAAGEYVGYMVGDVNNSAVLFDVDGFDHHSVIVNEKFHQKLNRVHLSDMWGSKISQSAMLNNHRVVHILMDGVNMDDIGPKFESLTYKLDMHEGAVNMFEMFGDVGDELSIFASQMQKLILMAQQAYDAEDDNKAIIAGSLEEIVTKFYTDRRMWHENAKENRDKLRVVNIPHDEIPMLREFVGYLDTAYKKIVASSARDENKLKAVSVLRLTFKNLLSNNGDLFDMITSDAIDGAKTGQRVLYDFGGLMLRGKGVAMAQLVNIIGFAVGNLGAGDVVIIHGTDLIDDAVKAYIDTQFSHLFEKGGRVVYIYNDTDKMLSDKSFCHFDKANYTIFGNMTETTVTLYQKELGQDIPPDLSRLVTNKSDLICYIRRGFDNVVFKQDLALGISSNKSDGSRSLKRRKRG